MPTRGALTLFRVRGIRVGVDYSWFLVLLLVLIWLSDFYRDVLGTSDGDMEPYALAVISAALFFGSILLHELGHALVALRNGIGITDITLWLFGGVARMSRDTETPGQEFRIAMAGPAVTFAIALACIGVGLAVEGQTFWEVMRFDEGAEISGPLAVVAWLASINALILIFNLIPAFPLDGGRVARAIAWKRTGNRASATRFAAALGQGFGYALMALGVVLALQGGIVDGLWLGVLGFILSASARSAVVQTELSSRIEHLRVADVMDPEPVSISEDVSVEQAIDEYFLRYRWPWFPVVDAAQRFIGLIKLAAADAIPEPVRETSRVADVVEERDGAASISVEASLESVLGNEALRRLGAIAAVDADGQLRGILTLEQVSRALRGAVVGSGPA